MYKFRTDNLGRGYFIRDVKRKSGTVFLQYKVVNNKLVYDFLKKYLSFYN